jgi:hypothetical protein
MTHNDLETRVHQISDQTLLSYIQQLLPAQAVDILERKSERIHKGTFGILYRFQGTAMTVDERFPWSLILKVVHHSGTEPLTEASHPINAIGNGNHSFTNLDSCDN